MKKRATPLVILILSLIIGIGCGTKNPTTATIPSAPTLPTGARDSVDANAFRVIADAYAFINSVQNSVTSGKLTLTAAQKTTLNNTIAAYNLAYATGLSYHSGTSNDAASLNAATAALSTNLTTASSQIAVPK